VRERAPGRARTRSGRVPWTLLAVLAATVLATLGPLGALSSPTAASGDATETRSAAPVSTSTATVSPAGAQRPDPVTDVSAHVTSAASESSPAASDLNPPSDGKALVTLALFVLVLCGVRRGCRVADEALSGDYLGAVDHVPRSGLRDSPARISFRKQPRHRPSSPPVLVRRRGRLVPIKVFDRTALAPCGLFARPRQRVATRPVDAITQRRPGDRLCRRLPRWPPQGGLPVALQDLPCNA
jgi:hypothetical protein